jgi:hypothetical protein
VNITVNFCGFFRVIGGHEERPLLVWAAVRLWLGIIMCQRTTLCVKKLDNDVGAGERGGDV